MRNAEQNLILQDMYLFNKQCRLFFGCVLNIFLNLRLDTVVGGWSFLLSSVVLELKNSFFTVVQCISD